MKSLSQFAQTGVAALLALAAAPAQAQNEAAVTNYYAPSYRALSGAESAFWNDSYTNASGGSNQAVVSAPGGSLIANAAVVQTTPGAFVIGSPGDIYSYSSVNTFLLKHTVSNHAVYSNGIGSVSFQVETAGSELDYSSVALTYSTCAGTQSITAPRQELYRDTEQTAFGPSSDVLSKWEWPALPVGITNFTIVFNASDLSDALERTMLDVAPAPLAAGPFAISNTPANLARWMYPFNQSPTNRPTASVFAAIGSLPDFDSRDGQYLLGWNAAGAVAAGQRAVNYRIDRARVTLTLSSDMYYAYDPTLRDYRTYFPTNDPRYVATSDPGSAIELYGAGFRGGFTNAQGAYVPYTALNFPQGGPYGANPSGGDYTNRVGFAACYDTNGNLVDVSDNIGDDGTNETAHPFEVAPFALGTNAAFSPGQLMPAGSQLEFDVNLNDPLIYAYLQDGLNEGNLTFVVSSLVNASYFSGTPNWPDFYTIFSALADPSEFPLLDIEGAVLRPCVDDTTTPAPQILALASKGGVTELRFTFAPNRLEFVQWSDDLKSWNTSSNTSLNYSSAWLAKAGTNVSYPSPVYAVWRDTNATAASTNVHRFYRVGTR